MTKYKKCKSEIKKKQS